MKKLTTIIITIAFWCVGLLFNPLVYATDLAYNSADISVTCHNDGSAHITEVWDVDAHVGKEMYLARENVDNQFISNLKVKLDDREYSNIGDWNTQGTLSDKAYKCGIVYKSSGYEICWGLSYYGNHIFVVSYDITNLVKECEDGSFIDQIFINKLSSNLKDAKITIEAENVDLTYDNTKIWSGGGAVGEIFIIDGKIGAKTTSSLYSGANFAVLAQFDKGIFSPKVFVEKTFTDIKDVELNGTDYKRDHETKTYSPPLYERLISVMFILILPMCIFLLLYIIFLKVARNSSSTRIIKDKFRKEYKNPDYFRNLPFGNSLPATYSRLKSLNRLTNSCSIIGVYLLKWIQEGHIKLVKVEIKKLFKKRNEDVIKIESKTEDMPILEKQLFDMLVNASDENGILKKNDFKKWCEHNFNSINRWLKDYDKCGFEELKRLEVVTQNNKKFFGIVKYTENNLTPRGIQCTCEMFGFKKYLQDFTIINERQAKEVELWQDYLIYAQMFGIAKEVSKQFENLYPKYFEEELSIDSSVPGTLIYMHINDIVSDYSHIAQNSYTSESYAASSGLGGSFSGGGFTGSSGGGSSGVR